MNKEDNHNNVLELLALAHSVSFMAAAFKLILTEEL